MAEADGDGESRSLRRRPPRPVLVLIAALAAVAAAAGVAADRLGPGATPLPALSYLGLLAVLAAGAYLHVEFRHGDDDVDALDLFEAAMAPVVFLLPGVAVVALVALAKGLAEGLLHVRPVKAAFNVAAWSAAAGAGSLVLASLGVDRPRAPGDLLVLAVAMVAVALVNQIAFVAVLRLAERRTVRQVLAELAPAIVPAWVVGGTVTLVFGILFAAAAASASGTVWLFLVPLVALHWASRGYAASRADANRLRGLHRATQALAAPVDLDRAIRAFLEEVRGCFDGQAVDLVVDEGVHRVRDPACPGRPDQPSAGLVEALLDLDATVRVTTRTDHTPVSAALAGDGWRECLAAPVRSAGRRTGVLSVYDQGGVMTKGSADLAVIEALAGEVGIALEQGHARAALRHSEARFRALVQNSSDVITVLDAGGLVTEMVPSLHPLAQTSLATTIGHPVLEAVHPHDIAGAQFQLRRLFERPGDVDRLEWRMRGSDGSWCHLETVATNLLGDPAVAGVVLNSRDITERKRAAALATGQAEVLGAIARNSPLEETITTLARAVESQARGSHYTVMVLGKVGSRPTTIGTPLPKPLLERLVVALAVADDSAVSPFAEGHALVVPDLEADPSWRVLGDGHGIRALWAAPIEGSGRGGRQLGLAVLHFDHPRAPDASDCRLLEASADLCHIAIEGVATQSRLVHQATHDPLTGLPNRVVFLDRTAVALARVLRTKRAVAVLFVDLDRFKRINDSLGHDAGDRLLITLATRLQAIMRPSDTVARFGGDEFTVLCEDIGGEDEATAIATRIREVLSVPITLDGHDVYVTASVGIAHTVERRLQSHELLENADAAMYAAKARGGDRHELYDATTRNRALRDLVTQQALRKALERDELRVHYQPTVDLTTGQVVGAEALVRWHHPDHGLIGPLDFIPLAEETGLIVPIGTLVMNEACRQVHRWLRESAGHFTMSVNLSARQFADPGLPEMVAAALAASGVSPAALALEITETVLMENGESTIEALKDLKHLGVRLVIDDFGTGYSSFSYLKQFPVDVIKVDRSFVGGLGVDPGDAAIVGAVVGLAHTFGMTAVAEGVETAEQVARLQALGCDIGQGHYFGRAVPGDALRLDSVSPHVPTRAATVR